MKKVCVITILLLCLTTIDLFSIETEFVGKLGTSYAKKPNKWGLDISINYLFNIDPFFAAGFDYTLVWIPWERTLDEAEFGLLATGDEIAKTQAIIMPLLFDAQLRLPNLVKHIYVEPSLTVGLGYIFMILDNSIPGEDKKTWLYHGFGWQIILSAAYRPGEESRIHFIIDFGYRGTSPERKNIKYDMSGFLIRAGVRIKI